MNLLKKFYCYLFYKFYRFFEFGAFSAWWSDTKASIYMNALLFCVLASLFVYYKTFINRSLGISYIMPIGIFLEILIIAFNYYLFNYKDKWKVIVKEFDKLPQIKNRIGGVIVWFFVFLVIANLVYSFYLTSQVDWSQYR